MTNFEFIKIMGVEQAVADITKIVLKEIEIRCPYEEMSNMDVADLQGSIEKWLNKKISENGKRACLANKKLKLMENENNDIL